MSQSISQTLLATSQLIELKIRELLEETTDNSVEAIERSAQIYELKQIMKYLEIKAAEYRIDYEESF